MRDAAIAALALKDKAQQQDTGGNGIASTKGLKLLALAVDDDAPGLGVAQGEEPHHLHLPGISLDRVSQLAAGHGAQPGIAKYLAVAVEGFKVVGRHRGGGNLQGRVHCVKVGLGSRLCGAGCGMRLQHTAQRKDLEDTVVPQVRQRESAAGAFQIAFADQLHQRLAPRAPASWTRPSRRRWWCRPSGPRVRSRRAECCGGCLHRSAFDG